VLCFVDHGLSFCSVSFGICIVYPITTSGIFKLLLICFFRYHFIPLKRNLRIRQTKIVRIKKSIADLFVLFLQFLLRIFRK
jgi:hypothetical protein